MKKQRFTTQLNKFLQTKGDRSYFDGVRLRSVCLQKEQLEALFMKKYRFAQTFEFFWDDPKLLEKCHLAWKNHTWCWRDEPNSYGFI